MTLNYLALVSFSVLFLSSLARGEEISAAAAWHRNFQGEGEGIVIGNLDETGAHFDVAGRLKKGGGLVDEETLFEVGSITKVFTGILLAHVVSEGKASLEDPISKFLPPGLLKADSPLHRVTLLDLTTHTSGLPRLPSNFREGGNPADPYVDYSVERLYDYLKGFKEEDFEKRGEMNYSNLGVGLLGHLLEVIMGKPYEALLKEVVFDPLGMSSSFVQRRADSIPPHLLAHLAEGHVAGKAVPPWYFDALCGAGAVVSSARDLLLFAKAYLSSETPQSLRVAMDLAATPRRGNYGLGWSIDDMGLHHNGRTSGFRSEFRISLEKKTASIRLVNGDGRLAETSHEGDFTDLSGFWQGTLELKSRSLRLVFRMNREGRVVLHSLDQGGSGVLADRAVKEADAVRLTFSSIGGAFEGRREGEVLVGRWTQNGTFPLRLSRMPEMPEALRVLLEKRATGDLSTVAGYWSGYLGGKRGLFVILEIESFDGTGEARFYSPDQTQIPMAVTQFALEGQEITLSIKSIRAKFTATLQDKNTLEGVWVQGKAPRALTLTRSEIYPERE